MTKCRKNLELRTHRSPCLKTNQKFSDETHNRLAASRSVPQRERERERRKNNVEIPQGSPDMCAAALFTDGITFQQYRNTLNSVT